MMPREASSRRCIAKAALAALMLAGALQPDCADARVLIVASDELSQYEAPIAAFEAAIGDVTEVINIEGSREEGELRLRNAATKPVDGIFALGSQAAYLSQSVLSGVPMVFAMVLDWPRYDFAATTSGVAVEMPVDVLFTRFKLLIPELQSVGVIYSESVSEEMVESARTAAATLGLSLVEEPVRFNDEVAGAYRRMRKEIDALWMIPDPRVVTRDNFAYLRTHTARDGVAFLAFSENFVRAGALISVSPSYATMGSQAAVLLQQLAEGKAPPRVQPPLGSTLVVNAATARRLGLQLEAQVLSTADLVIDEP